MANVVVVPIAVKGVAPALIALAGVALIAAIIGAVIRSAADRGEARSRGDVSSRRRALDELVGQGLMKPEEYAARQAAILQER